MTGPLRILIIGAHPDDCEYRCAGTAWKWSLAGAQVKFLSVTQGAAGHHQAGGAALVYRRRSEAEKAARRLGVAASEVLDYPDGELMATLQLRREMIRQIRDWRADLVIVCRPYDYHPDHRYASIAVQDAAYLVMVPNVCPGTPPLNFNPVFLYCEDEFQKPLPFQPDIAVSIDDAWEKKLDALDAHDSQFYEWLPWVEGQSAEVPADPSERRRWLGDRLTRPLTEAARASLHRRYGDGAASITRAECYELCEYGRQPDWNELNTLFPR